MFNRLLGYLIGAAVVIALVVLLIALFGEFDSYALRWEREFGK